MQEFSKNAIALWYLILLLIYQSDAHTMPINCGDNKI